jgi:tetratricopeptide (TPR) repeat protein
MPIRIEANDNASQKLLLVNDTGHLISNSLQDVRALNSAHAPKSPGLPELQIIASENLEKGLKESAKGNDKNAVADFATEIAALKKMQPQVKLSVGIDVSMKLVQAYNNKAWSELALHQPAQALADIKNVFPISDDSGAYDTKAVAEMMQGHYADAAKDLDKCDRVRLPGKGPDGDVLYHEALAFSKVGRLADAQRALKEARQTNYVPAPWETKLLAPVLK